MSKKQQMRYTDAELSMIQNTFRDNDGLLMTMRKVFLQMDLSDDEKKIIVGNFKGKKDLLALMSKTFNPTLDPDAPRHQLMDLWLTVDVEKKAIDDLLPVFKAREMLIKLLSQQLGELEYISEGLGISRKINIDSLTKLGAKSAESFYTGLVARNTLIMHVEVQLSQLEILAGQDDETVEETKERLEKDSTK